MAKVDDLSAAVLQGFWQIWMISAAEWCMECMLGFGGWLPLNLMAVTGR